MISVRFCRCCCCYTSCPAPPTLVTQIQGHIAAAAPAPPRRCMPSFLPQQGSICANTRYAFATPVLVGGFMRDRTTTSVYFHIRCNDQTHTIRPHARYTKHTAAQKKQYSSHMSLSLEDIYSSHSTRGAPETSSQSRKLKGNIVLVHIRRTYLVPGTTSTSPGICYIFFGGTLTPFQLKIRFGRNITWN